MRRLLDMPVGRVLTLGAAVMFGVFFIAAAVAAGISGRDGISVVAGVLAYAYLAFVVVVVGRAWLRRPKGAERAVRAYIEAQQPGLDPWVGRPVRLSLPAMPAADAPGQANLSVGVSGPVGEGTVDMVLARLGREWEVLQAVLITDGERVPLTPAGR